MTVASGSRNIGNSVGRTLGIGLLGIGGLIFGVLLLGLAYLHAAAGIPTAILPAAGGAVLLEAAIAILLLPLLRRAEIIQTQIELPAFVVALVFTTVATTAFILLGSAP
ncbi:hypothetical protein LPA44_15920 [Halobacterium sp. KA-4]|uniref:hypothetical protein n=1 Tax=Halobacterium sp. KA-4 TaxID=2896367 RepID=UPI001E50A484|nr:hypothetical protein [Halobacterium sp. KA-4]MCD2201359.1 hypothetical protein [Halobacterium sp. KA-4]